MDDKWFAARYGGIKVRGVVPYRNPVVNTCEKDRNRKLMLKFKYGNLTKDEEREFHEAVKKLIYKVMHSNNVMMNWDDVYQEIWRKICRSRHTWNEDKGTYVSTWITIVASTVISTLRTNVKKYNSRFCLYDDMVVSSDSDASTEYKMNALSSAAEDDDEDVEMVDKFIWKEQYDEFIRSLSPAEKAVMTGATDMEDKFVAASRGSGKLPFASLREKLGYDEATFNLIMYNIRRKYCEAFDKEFMEFESSSDTEEGFTLLF